MNKRPWRAAVSLYESIGGGGQLSMLLLPHLSFGKFSAAAAAAHAGGGMFAPHVSLF